MKILKMKKLEQKWLRHLDDEWDEEDHFKDFKTVVNGKEVKSLSYRLTDLVPKDVKGLNATRIIKLKALIYILPGL